MTGRNKMELSVGLEGGEELLIRGIGSEVRTGDRALAGAGQAGVVWPEPGG